MTSDPRPSDWRLDARELWHFTFNGKGRRPDLERPISTSIHVTLPSTSDWMQPIAIPPLRSRSRPMTKTRPVMGAKDKIEVTPEMVEAGIKAHQACQSPFVGELVRRVFVAMLRASRSSLPKTARKS